jgi:hypothetical protein
MAEKEGRSLTSRTPALYQARSRLVQKVLEVLARRGCAINEVPCELRRGLRLYAPDATTLSMPGEAALLQHCGSHPA